VYEQWNSASPDGADGDTGGAGEEAANREFSRSPPFVSLLSGRYLVWSIDGLSG